MHASKLERSGAKARGLCPQAWCQCTFSAAAPDGCVRAWSSRSQENGFLPPSSVNFPNSATASAHDSLPDPPFCIYK